MLRYCFLILCTLMVLQANARPKAETRIRQILKAQEQAWNQGDLHRFMKGYWESDSMLFMGKKGPTYGYDATLNNYLKGYPDTAHMGHFTSSVLQVRKLSRQYYIVVGRWQLQRSIGDVGGYYSLLFRKKKGQWVIVMDHTS
ncbi:MAG: nuclear transport factor 2 family protein [Chitinophagaceae bacterium]|nr:nuclear transport factor 2 family protein [Chitinophagaceae bacterium]